MFRAIARISSLITLIISSVIISALGIQLPILDYITYAGILIILLFVILDARPEKRSCRKCKSTKNKIPKD